MAINEELDGRTKLSAQQVAELRKLYWAGFSRKAGKLVKNASFISQAKLGARFGVSPRYVNSLVHKQARA